MMRRSRRRRDEQRVSDILAAITKVKEWSNHLPHEADYYRAAVLRELTVIGEAAANMSQVFKASHPDIAWSEVIAFRNLAVHHYWDVAWPMCEDIVHSDLPDLARHLDASDFAATRTFGDDQTEVEDNAAIAALEHLKRSSRTNAGVCGARTARGKSCQNPVGSCPHHTH
ncbi:MAG: DUF86 domain-containing protein [Actinomycetota bacterium]|jgi:uncharacterized protein with HEPN domain|nr:DUF86 domain-containing protein [Actinomycetota bacterium]